MELKAYWSHSALRLLLCCRRFWYGKVLSPRSSLFSLSSGARSLGVVPPVQLLSSLLSHPLQFLPSSLSTRLSVSSWLPLPRRYYQHAYLSSKPPLSHSKFPLFLEAHLTIHRAISNLSNRRHDSRQRQPQLLPPLFFATSISHEPDTTSKPDRPFDRVLLSTSSRRAAQSISLGLSSACQLQFPASPNDLLPFHIYRRRSTV